MKKHRLKTAACFLLTALLLVSCTKAPYVENFKTAGEGQFSYDNATVYFAITDRFYDGNPSNNNAYGRPTVDALGSDAGTFNGGDIEGLTQKLEEGYFEALGVDVLWISAPYEQIHGYIGGGDGAFAHYGFHGYYALDWTSMDQNFGTVEAFKTFVDTAHAQGIRVVLDVVVNHVGYPNYADMVDFGYGAPTAAIDTVAPKSGETFNKWTDFVDWDAFDNWWGPWVRADLDGYSPPGNDVYTQNLMGLPDVRTELTEDVGLPPILKTKWAAAPPDDPWALPGADALRTDRGLSPAGYIELWLAAWVETFGIDGFRIDTAKHVDVSVWNSLKTQCDAALQRYRAANPQSPAADFTDPFFFVGEVWGHGVSKDYYYDNGFDALINFTFQGERKDGPAYTPDKMPAVFKNYAAALNADSTFNVLSYLSQHDTSLYPRDRLIEGGTFLLLLPGAVQLFYGDETARPAATVSGDATMGTRSKMNWDTTHADVLAHFQKLGTFRKRNLAVGAGTHVVLSESPYVFTRSFTGDGFENRVVVALGDSGRTTLDVGDFAEDGTVLRDAYTQRFYTVKNGAIVVDVHANGLALIEFPE